MTSPIETMLREALLRAAPAPWLLVDATGHASAIPETLASGIRNTRWSISPCVWLDNDEQHQRAIYLHSAVSVLTYRADFLLELGVRKLAIECDGHEFHDRTKQQAAYDRSRDRELLQIGIATIRFTGSEIVHSPDRCATEAYRCLLALPDVGAARREGYEDAIYFSESWPGVEEHW